MFSGYILMAFEDSKSAQDAYLDFHDTECVVYCEAVHDDYDMVLLVQAEDASEWDHAAKQFTKTPGAKDVCLLPITRTSSNAPVNLTAGASSFVLLDIDKTAEEKVFAALDWNSGVSSCDLVNGKYNAVLLMQGSSFLELDRLIQTRIKPLEGVLRIKEMPIIRGLEN